MANKHKGGELVKPAGEAALKTDFPLSEKDEIAAASRRTRKLYENQQQLKKKDDHENDK